MRRAEGNTWERTATPDRGTRGRDHVSESWRDLPCPGRARADEVLAVIWEEMHPDTAAPGAARRALAEWAPLLGAEAMDDVRILVSELVANVVLHAGSGDPVELEAFLLPDEVAVSVADSGPGFEPTDLRGSLTGEPGGRGLELVAALARGFGIDSRDPFRVWFSVARPPGGPSGPPGGPGS